MFVFWFVVCGLWVYGFLCVCICVCDYSSRGAYTPPRPDRPNNPHPRTKQIHRYIVVPLMAGYALYSLVHERHKGWYSWAVTSLTGFVYVFGFVMMTPQVGMHISCFLCLEVLRYVCIFACVCVYCDAAGAFSSRSVVCVHVCLRVYDVWGDVGTHSSNQPRVVGRGGTTPRLTNVYAPTSIFF